MTDISPEPDAPQQPLPGAAPAGHESITQHLRDWLASSRARNEVRTAEQVFADLQPLMPPHVATVFAHAARLLADPQHKELWPDVLDLAFGAAQIGLAAL